MTPSEPLEITGNELVNLLRTHRDQYPCAGCVVLDCRPFLDFSLTHIYESRNVNWNSMLRRRSKSSVVALEWLIPDKLLLGRLRRAEFSAVVVLDEGSRCVTELKPESVIKMLLSALQNETQAQICFLQGNLYSNAFWVLFYGGIEAELVIFFLWILLSCSLLILLLLLLYEPIRLFAFKWCWWKPWCLFIFWPPFRWIWGIFRDLPRAVLHLCQWDTYGGSWVNRDRKKDTSIRPG